MNTKRLVLTLVIGFLFFFGSDFVIHGVWLAPDYKATAALWRTDSEMSARMPWMIGAHLLLSVAFVVLWAKGFADRGGINCAVNYGFLMGLFYQSSTLITYVVSPLPMQIAMKWLFSGIAQSVLLGIIVFLVYKPRTLTTQ
jgi:hypothetical protein